jgi:hypothetical protein
MKPGPVNSLADKSFEITARILSSNQKRIPRLTARTSSEAKSQPAIVATTSQAPRKEGASWDQ